jgi:hypothetical protein
VKQQMRDITRLTVTSHALQDRGEYCINLTVGFVVAPLSLSLGPGVIPNASLAQVPHLDGVRVQTANGTPRLVVPLQLPAGFVRPMAFERSRGME